MVNFNENTECYICKKEQLCQKVTLYNEKYEPNEEFWCKTCTDDIEKSCAEQQYEEEQRFYEELSRSDNFI